MNRCPTAEQVRRTVNEASSEAAFQQLLAHVNECARCQETIESVIDTSSVSEWTILTDSVSKYECPPDVLRRLKELPEDDVPASVQFPGAPTEKGPLGQLDCYHIIEHLGSGASGLVYKAFDESLCRTVAIKLLRPELAAISTDKQRFEREARMAADLQPDHVVSIYSFGRSADFAVPYIVMEYIDGESLAERLRQDRVLEPTAAADIVMQVARGIHPAHESAIVHRDVKPSNIIISKVSGKAKVADFGLARAYRTMTDSTLYQITQSASIVGSPSYMSPEQIASPDEIDHRTDIYSLGVVLYELMTGVLPFQDRNDATGLPSLFEKIQFEEPIAPRRLNGAIDHDVETITLKCLEKNRENRYATASELSDDLSRYLHGEPVNARRIGRVEKTRRWCQRKPALAGLVLASVLVLTTTAGWIVRELYAYRRSQSQMTELLVSNAQTFAQRGDWRAALTNIDRAQSLEYTDPVGIRLARVRALVAINSNEYTKELQSLCERSDLGKHAAKVYLLQGMSLTLRGKQEAGIEFLRRARSLGTLTPAEAAVADAILAETSPELIRKLELAVTLDPLSHYAQSYLIGTLMMSGRFDESIRRAKVAAVLFPESPTFPIALALAAAWNGDQKQVDDYLQMPACDQLLPDAVDAFRGLLGAVVNVSEVIATGWEIDVTVEEYESVRQRNASAMPFIIKATEHFAVPGRLAHLSNEFPRTNDPDWSMLDLVDFSNINRDKAHTSDPGLPDFPSETTIGMLGEAGIPCISLAYEPLRDVLSLRTYGFLMTGKGSIERIDQLIEQCDQSSQIHPDGFFQCTRGRLLYARDRLDEAAAAYGMAASTPCSIPALRVQACANAARCYFELFEQGEVDALPKALRFVQQRLKMGTVGSRHAKLLSKIALIAGDYDAARQILQDLAAVNDASWIALRRAEIELADGRYAEAVNFVREISEDSKLTGQANRIMAEALLRARERADKVARAVE